MSSSHDASAIPLDLLLPQGAPPELIAAIEGAARDKLARHGAGAFAAPREAAAVHEASHAIVGTHEGISIRRIKIYSRSDPMFGTGWGGRCFEAGWGWTTGPDSSADDDLKRARFIIAGLAGEAACGLDKPGSSLDELALSQWLGIYAASKLGNSTLSGEDNINNAYAQQLWHEQVWRVALKILCNNREPFMRLTEHLYQHERIEGEKLRKLLAQVKRIAP